MLKCVNFLQVCGNYYIFSLKMYNVTKLFVIACELKMCCLHT